MAIVIAGPGAGDSQANHASAAAHLGQIDLGSAHSCAVTSAGLRCWGTGAHGRLGYGHRRSVGAAPRSLPADTGPVRLGRDRSARQVTSGNAHTCAVTDLRQVRCWGLGTDGRLGLGSERSIGDDEHPSSPRAIDFGRPRLDVAQVAAGSAHTCALLRSGRHVHCWGANHTGQLGLGHTHAVGDDETVGDEAPISFGVAGVKGYANLATDVVAGSHSTCALTDRGDVHCWGANDTGQLGLGTTAPPLDRVGDDEGARSVGPVPLPSRAIDVAAGRRHHCAVDREHRVWCWGLGSSGQLGHGSSESLGDDEPVDARGPVDVGGDALAVAAGDAHTCALIEGGAVRCWGAAESGQLGHGAASHGTAAGFGDEVGEIPASLPPVDLGAGRSAVALAAGGSHTCAVLDDGSLRCWGANGSGQLGVGSREHLGDDMGETPASASPVSLGGIVPIRAVRITVGVRGQVQAHLRRQGKADARVGRPIDLELRASNGGPDRSGPLKVAVSLPAGARIVATTAPGGRFVRSRGLRRPSRGRSKRRPGMWHVGSLEPGARRTMTLRLRTIRAGWLPVRAHVVDNGPAVVDRVSTAGGGPRWESDGATEALLIDDARPRRIALRVRFMFERRGIRLVAAGRMVPPRGLGMRAACRGQVLISVRGGPLVERRVRLRRVGAQRCVYSRVLRLGRRALEKRPRRRLRVTATFLGNRALDLRRSQVRSILLR